LAIQYYFYYFGASEIWPEKKGVPFEWSSPMGGGLLYSTIWYKIILIPSPSHYGLKCRHFVFEIFLFTVMAVNFGYHNFFV